MSEKDFVIERALQIPECTRTVLEELLKRGAELTCPVDELSHAEQVEVIREIIAQAPAPLPRVKRTKEQVANSKKQKRVLLDGHEMYVSDHALWRYAQRFHGMPSMKEMRKDIAAYLNQLGTVEQANRAGFRIIGKTIVTYAPKGCEP